MNVRGALLKYIIHFIKNYSNLYIGPRWMGNPIIVMQPKKYKIID